MLFSLKIHKSTFQFCRNLRDILEISLKSGNFTKHYKLFILIQNLQYLSPNAETKKTEIAGMELLY